MIESGGESESESRRFGLSSTRVRWCPLIIGVCMKDMLVVLGEPGEKVLAGGVRSGVSGFGGGGEFRSGLGAAAAQTPEGSDCGESSDGIVAGAAHISRCV